MFTDLKIKKSLVILQLILSAVLFTAQVASANHDLDHLYHKANQSCDAFLAFEHSASMLDCLIPLLPPSEQHQLEASLDASLLTLAPVHFSIRAPPLTLLN